MATVGMIGKLALPVLLFCMVATAPHTAEAALTCQTVVNSLSPCTGYLTTGGAVPTSCCNGVRSLYAQTTTTADRQTACRCMEQASSMLPSISINYASSLPGKCGVNIPYKISPNTDCSKVQ